MRSFLAALTAVSLVLTGCASPPWRQAQPAPAPSPASGQVMVAAANPLAVEAGLNVLRRGGGAIDAAVAVQTVLGLVEPQSSGLGGGAFLVYFDAASGKVTAYDGRETAPAGADPKMFLGEDGKPIGFIDAILSGRSTGAPGAVAMLAMAHKDHGKLAWSGLFGEAEGLADNGFKVSPRLAGYLVSPFPQAKTPDALRYFTKADGKLYAAGDVLKNPAYADSLRQIAARGPDGLLKGEIAASIVKSVGSDPRPGTLSLSDLAAYRPLRKEALCQPYRLYVVCTAQPASSGVSLLQALKLLEKTDIAERGPKDPVSWIQIAQAERLMYADRDRYVGDPAFVSVPVEGLLNPGYVAERARAIGETMGPEPVAGLPPGAAPRAADSTKEPGGTSHMVIVDAAGNVVSMTTTVESVFGSGRMASGFFLNNQLTDFNFSPDDPDGAPAANAVAAGKRPRSSMSPVIVLDREGRFVAALGSPGGSSILAYNLKALVGVLDWGLPMQEAIDLPNLVVRSGRASGEVDRFGPEMVQALTARGLALRGNGGENSGLHGVIVREGGRLEGGADSRREGVARGF